MRYAVALYMSSVLGSGVLVLPGLAAQIAGPASLIAWLLLSLASYPLAYTFAGLSARSHSRDRWITAHCGDRVCSTCSTREFHSILPEWISPNRHGRRSHLLVLPWL